MCKVCGTRQVHVSRVLKEAGLSKQFSGLSKEIKTQFWKDVRSDGSKANILKLCKRSLQAYEESGVEGRANGAYEPLGYYATKGYDTKRIEDLCTDTMDHAVLGKCYKIDVISGGEYWKRGKRQTDELHNEETIWRSCHKQ